MRSDSAWRKATEDSVEMKTSTDKLVGQNLLEASLARERNKEHDPPDPLWSLAVTQALVKHLPRLTLPEASLDPSRNASAPSTHSGDGAPVAEESVGDMPLGAERARESRPAAPNGVPAEICAEVSDNRLGRLRLHVARGENGLDIVINVADERVKGLLLAEQSSLMTTLKAAGLRVASVQIGSASRVGTGLAVEGVTERPRLPASPRQLGARRRTYQGSLDEDEDADSEGLDFTA
jgi:hypothetical protein